jgi:hypothetical protein
MNKNKKNGKKKMVKPMMGNPRANGLAEGQFHVPTQSHIPACEI